MRRQTNFWMKAACVAGAVLIAAFSFATLKPVSVQAAPVHKAAAQEVTITIEGVVSSINGNTWVVGGVTITITAQTVISGTPTVGSVVQVVAVADGDNTLVAQSITVVVTATNTPGPSPTPSSTPTATLTGTVGSSPTPTPTTAGTPVPYVVIIIEGPIEEIDVNVIVVYGMHIKLHDNDPELAHLKVGEWVHVDGDEEDDNGTIVIVVINIIVINPPPAIIVVPPSDNCGKKHCHEGDDD